IDGYRVVLARTPPTAIPNTGSDRRLVKTCCTAPAVRSSRRRSSSGLTAPLLELRLGHVGAIGVIGAHHVPLGARRGDLVDPLRECARGQQVSHDQGVEGRAALTVAG